MARKSPARATLVIFFFLVLIQSLLLSLPIATRSGRRAPYIDALFTAVSSVCVTGLTTVDTAEYWSVFGQGIIALGIAIGGLGVMTLASLLALAVSSHLGLTQRIIARDSGVSGGMSDVGRLIRNVALISLAVEGVVFLALAINFLRLGYPWEQSFWDAMFMAISSFNNAGFVNVAGGAAQFIGDAGFLLPITAAATVGALGFPVLVEIVRRHHRPRRWSLHTKLTLTVFGGLFLLSFAATALVEWNNPATFGPLTIWEKILNSLLAGVNTRSLGVSAVDVGSERPITTFLSGIFMFIGGGSASTAGGIKVTTFAVLVLAVAAEAKGYRDVEAFGRRMSPGTVRLAVSVLFVSVALVIGGSFFLLALSPYSLEQVLFETISAFGTVGLSTGITPYLDAAPKAVLAALMFAGRLGPITVATALALRERPRLIRMPEGRPIVG